MNKKFPITWDKIRNHFTYSWWIYALVVALSIFGWNLVFNVTRYQSPEHLKVEFYYCGGRVVTEKDIHELMAQLHQELFPDMEEVSYVELLAEDDYYGAMTIVVKTMNGEGDVYLINKSSFLTQGISVMEDLEPYVESGQIDVGDLDLSSGYLVDSETGEKHLYGIPASHLKGFEEYGIFVDDYFLSIPVLCGNAPKAVELINYFLAEMQ